MTSSFAALKPNLPFEAFLLHFLLSLAGRPHNFTSSLGWFEYFSNTLESDERFQKDRFCLIMFNYPFLALCHLYACVRGGTPVPIDRWVDSAVFSPIGQNVRFVGQRQRLVTVPRVLSPNALYTSNLNFLQIDVPYVIGSIQFHHH